MFTRFIRFILCFLLVGTFHVQAVVITDIQGRQLEADVLEVRESSIYVRRTSDQGLFEIPFSRLSEADRERFMQAGTVAGSALNFSRQLVGVEQKAAREDQGIHVVPDMFYGLPPEVLVERLREMEVNLLVVPISKKDQEPTVAYLRGLKDAGASSFLSVIISSRRWSLDREIQRERWATEVAATYNACQMAGVADLIKGCRFDENDPLKGVASTEAQWTEHFDNIVDAIDLLNAKTNDAIKSRTVMIHGEGYGSNFKGTYRAHIESDFEAKMRTRCQNYCFSFKLFVDGGPARGKESTVAEWIEYYLDHCGLREFNQLKKPIVFVGNSGDGLFPGSFRALDATEEVREWHCRTTGLLKVFQEYAWKHFSFGPIIQPSSEKGRTLLNYVTDGEIVPRANQMNDWNTWKTTVR